MKLIYNIFGLDHRFIGGLGKRESDRFIILLGFILVLSFVGFWTTFKLTIQSSFLSITLSFAVSAFVLNMYRLIFSISDNESDQYLNRKKAILFILKRSPILIILALVVSASIQTLVFRYTVKEGLVEYKNQLINDYSRSVEASTFQEIEDIEIEYERARAYYLDLGMDKSIIELTKDKESNLLAIRQKTEMNMNTFKSRIDSSDFFMAQIRLLIQKNPFLFLIFTIIIVALYLFPIYNYISSNYLKNYTVKQKDISKRIILDEFNGFKEIYRLNFKNSTGLDLKFESKFEDPPFNLVGKPKDYKVLKKGSLAKWYSEILQ